MVKRLRTIPLVGIVTLWLNGFNTCAIRYFLTIGNGLIWPE